MLEIVEGEAVGSTGASILVRRHDAGQRGFARWNKRFLCWKPPPLGRLRHEACALRPSGSARSRR